MLKGAEFGEAWDDESRAGGGAPRGSPWASDFKTAAALFPLPLLWLEARARAGVEHGRRPRV